jgi:hypothetical protein
MESSPPFHKCTIHDVPAAGVVYYCPSCNRWFCNDCVHFYISDARACPACGFPADVTGIEKHADNSEFPGDKVTVVSQDVIGEMERLGIGEEIFDEVLCAVKAVPPGQRVAYLRQLFGNDGDRGDPAADL